MKFSQNQKEEIITLKFNGTKVKEIMEKFNVSRAHIYKILKENDIDYKSEIQTNIDITEINEIIDSEEEDIFDELNNDETIKKIQYTQLKIIHQSQNQSQKWNQSHKSRSPFYRQSI